MAEFKIVVGNKGKSYSKALNENESSAFLNKKMGEKIEGSSFGFSGYEMEITGGSDYCGFPMRKDVSGTMRKAILTTSGLGNKYVRKGMRLRRTVAGNTIFNKTTQVNLKVVKHGAEPLIKEESKSEEKKE